MAWYRDGTISVTLNSSTVTGAATRWVGQARIGDGLIGPDGRVYEVVNIASDTSLKIDPAYKGATAAGQPYAIAPVQGYVRTLADQAARLLNGVGPELSNKVDKVAGKGLSTNDFGDAEEQKLADVAEGATKNRPDEELLDRANQTGQLNFSWCVYGGGVNAIQLTSEFKRESLKPGDVFRFQGLSNTGPVTIDVDGLGPKRAVTVTGVDLPPGYIRTGYYTEIYFDGGWFFVRRLPETGENSNGRFSRFEDGSLRVSGVQDLGNVDVNSLVQTTINYAAGFVDETPAQVTAISGWGYSVAVGCEWFTAVNSGFSLVRREGSEQQHMRLAWTAMGRWY